MNFLENEKNYRLIVISLLVILNLSIIDLKEEYTQQEKQEIIKEIETNLKKDLVKIEGIEK